MGARKILWSPIRKMSSLRSAVENLSEQFQREGLFAISKGRKALYCVELMLLLVGAFILLHHGATFFGMVLLTFFYPRAAFAGHDVAHGQWFGRNAAATRYAAALLGFLQGFGAVWWSEKHDVHHDFPNGYRRTSDGPKPVDGDIDTAPWLVWDRSLHSPLTRGRLVQLQALLLFPLLMFTRMNWSQQGFRQALRQGNFCEAAYILAHWIFGLALAGWLAPSEAWIGWLWFLGAQMAGGFLLGCVFVLNHTGMEVYDIVGKDDFFERQACSTRNTPVGFFFDWLTGGLNSHIEHHMFPGLPRHNLTSVGERVRQAMQSRGFEYARLSNRAAFATVFRTLDDAARA